MLVRSEKERKEVLEDSMKGNRRKIVVNLYFYNAHTHL